MNVLEAREVCPACGHINGHHLDKCQLGKIQKTLLVFREALEYIAAVRFLICDANELAELCEIYESKARKALAAGEAIKYGEY